jgi:hypothetical protein
VSLIRDTKTGTRHERQEKEAELAGAALMEDDVEEQEGEDEVMAERNDVGEAWLEEHEIELFGQIGWYHMADRDV